MAGNQETGNQEVLWREEITATLATFAGQEVTLIAIEYDRLEVHTSRHNPNDPEPQIEIYAPYEQMEEILLFTQTSEFRLEFWSSNLQTTQLLSRV